MVQIRTPGLWIPAFSLLKFRHEGTGFLRISMAFCWVFFSNKDIVFICICCQSLEFSKCLKIFGATNISLSLCHFHVTKSIGFKVFQIGNRRIPWSRSTLTSPPFRLSNLEVFSMHFVGALFNMILCIYGAVCYISGST